MNRALGYADNVDEPAGEPAEVREVVVAGKLPHIEVLARVGGRIGKRIFAFADPGTRSRSVSDIRIAGRLSRAGHLLAGHLPAAPSACIRAGQLVGKAVRSASS